MVPEPIGDVQVPSSTPSTAAFCFGAEASPASPAAAAAMSSSVPTDISCICLEMRLLALLGRLAYPSDRSSASLLLQLLLLLLRPLRGRCCCCCCCSASSLTRVQLLGLASTDRMLGVLVPLDLGVSQGLPALLPRTRWLLYSRVAEAGLVLLLLTGLPTLPAPAEVGRMK